MANVTVLGAGAWGTAFGQVLADAGNNVTMWAIEPEIVEGIRDHHHNGVRLPSVETLPSNMTATGDRAEAVANADIVIVAIAAPCFQPFASVLPLFFPRITIYYLQITGKYKPLAQAAPAQDVSVEDEPVQAAAQAEAPGEKGGET